MKGTGVLKTVGLGPGTLQRLKCVMVVSRSRDALLRCAEHRALAIDGVRGDEQGLEQSAQ
jgi:hypothetical protein